MASVNKVIIIGNVGQDPEVRYTANGVAVVNLSVATSRKWKDKSGDKQEETEWHRVVAYDRTAEVIGDYVKKGSRIYIEGRLKTRKWEDKEGVERYTTEIVTEQLQLMGDRNRDEEDRPTRYQRENRAPAKKTSSTKTNTGFDDMDDDIPF